MSLSVKNLSVVFSFLCLLLSSLQSSSVFANDTVLNRPGPSNIPSPQDPATHLQDALNRVAVRGQNNVEKELNCTRDRLIRRQAAAKATPSKDDDFDNLLGGDQARWDCMLKVMSPAIQRSMDKFKMTNDIERSLFYAHVIVESGGFNYFSETKKFETFDCKSAGDTAITQLIQADSGTADFGAGGGKGSWSMGDNRGFGPIQITGCSNRLSVIHYLNQFYRNPSVTPSWREDWRYTNSANTTTQIKGECTLAERERMIQAYAVTNQANANLYGAFHDSVNFGHVGTTLTDAIPANGPQMGITPMAPLSSTEFMFDGALAYFKGRNQEMISQLNTPSDLYTSECKDVHFRAGDDWKTLAVRCSTRRIRGLTASQTDILNSSTKSRLRYFEELTACMQ